MVSSRDAGHHRESVGLHPTPCTEQPVNRDLQIPVVCLSGFLLSVSPQAVPAQSTPAFRLPLVRSCRGGTSPESHSGLQLTSIIELEKARFARYFQKLYRFFAFSQIGIRKGGFIYNFLKFSKIHIDPRGRASWLGDEFHRANQ